MRFFYLIILFAGLLTDAAFCQPSSKSKPALFPVRAGGFYGFINTEGQLVIAPQYNDAFAFNEGLAFVRRGKYYGMINEQAKIIIPFRVNRLERHFTEGMIPIPLLSGGYRYFTDKGDSLPFLFTKAGNFFGGLALVQFPGDPLLYFINKTGKKAFPKGYAQAQDFQDGLAAVQINGKWGFIDNKGNLVINPRYDLVKSFKEGFAAVLYNGKVGYINRQDKWLVEPTYENADFFFEGAALVMLNRKIGFIDSTGKTFCEPQFDAGHGFSEGMAFVGTKKDTAYFGFIDKTGKVVVPIKYDRVIPYSEGLSAVNYKGKWGFIDKTGKMVIPPTFDDAESFYGGLARVTIGGPLSGIGHDEKIKFGYINKQGNYVWAPTN